MSKKGQVAATEKSKELTSNEVRLQKVLEDLHLHQAELEMQNDELRIANEKLELQQIKFSGIYDLAPIGYYILDKNGLVTEVNNAGVNLLGVARGVVVGKRLQSFVTEDHRDIYHIFLRKMLSSGEKQSCQLKINSARQGDFYVQMEGIAIQPVRSLPLQCDIAVIDITERVKTENDLSKTKERLELALEASSSGTWDLNADTMIFHLDESNLKICGLPGPKFDGKYQSFINLINPEDKQSVDKAFRNAIIHKQEINIECRFSNKITKDCFVNIRGHVHTGKHQSDRFIGTMTDITLRKNLEEEAQRIKREQQRNIALATVDAEENERIRISDALHDSVSQLLYGIRLKLELVLDAERPDEVIKEVSDLLAMATRETRNISFELAPSILTDFGLPTTIDEMAKRLSTSNLTIRTNLSRLERRMDILLETNIFRILQELVNNAMKHANASLIVIDVRKGAKVELSVSDNGSGFLDGPDYISMGSGLSRIKNRLSLYNGTLVINSKPGEGTTVAVTLDTRPS
ncbi:sensor histidine kinase [Mucilaginibacter ginkgonis]|uniref:histidine kinase n=1 Tax=Mucilaginibacter ginkgonis TaxID=2682091 RepID=A0A6I4IMX7_9SPHI|nr:PAS domain S-box protein [Mucilaginibacter ginkgonis]QQL51218.1 PAS domain S-box protein [Mucilaginibacter ginkgonis]